MEFQTEVLIGYNYESSTFARRLTRKGRVDQWQIYWTEKASHVKAKRPQITNRIDRKGTLECSNFDI